MLPGSLFPNNPAEYPEQLSIDHGGGVNEDDKITLILQRKQVLLKRGIQDRNALR